MHMSTTIHATYAETEIKICVIADPQKFLPVAVTLLNKVILFPRIRVHMWKPCSI